MWIASIALLTTAKKNSYNIEDVLLFKQDVDASFKCFSKMRGKKAEAAAMSALFTTLLEQEFPEIFQTDESGDAMQVEVEDNAKSKKRARLSIDSTTAAAGAMTMDSAEKPAKKRSSALRQSSSGGGDDEEDDTAQAAAASLTSTEKVK